MKYNPILFNKKLHSFMPHLITTHARCKCCTTYETVPWPCALRVTESSIIMLKSWRDRLDNCAHDLPIESGPTTSSVPLAVFFSTCRHSSPGLLRSPDSGQSAMSSKPDRGIAVQDAPYDGKKWRERRLTNVWTEEKQGVMRTGWPSATWFLGCGG
jgi:hypothetical protein